MVAWKKRLAAERGVRLRDRLLIMTDVIGKLGSATASITNRLLENPRVRGILERVMGIHRDRRVLHFSGETFPRWFGRRTRTATADPPVRKVALFSSCLVNFQVTDVGKATVQVLEKNGVQVVVPEQRCCGMPSFDIGDTQAIQQAARSNVASLYPLVVEGYDVVVPTASCSLMLKREYPELHRDEQTKRVAERTFDVCEYLMAMKKTGHLADRFHQEAGTCRLSDSLSSQRPEYRVQIQGAHGVRRGSGRGDRTMFGTRRLLVGENGVFPIVHENRRQGRARDRANTGGSRRIGLSVGGITIGTSRRIGPCERKGCPASDSDCS